MYVYIYAFNKISLFLVHATNKQYITLMCVCVFPILSLPPDISQVQTCIVCENMYIRSSAERHAPNYNCLHVPGTDLQRT